MTQNIRGFTYPKEGINREFWLIKNISKSGTYATCFKVIDRYTAFSLKEAMTEFKTRNKIKGDYTIAESKGCIQ